MAQGKPLRLQIPGTGSNRSFIVDFYCAELKLVIEMDGRHHLSDLALFDYDSDRTLSLNLLGLRVFRMANEELRDTELAAQQIRWMIEQCGGRPPHPPSAPSPPRAGEKAND